MARRAARLAAAPSLLPGHLHAALRAACNRPAAATDDLLAALSYVRRGVAAAGPRPTLSGWPDWHAGRLADLDTRPALPPSRPLSGAGVGPDARWQTLAGRHQRFPDARQTTWPAVSSEISRGLAPDGVGGPG